MRVSTRLLQACRITLFTRENCGLCTQARSVLSDVWDKRPFAFKEIDIIKPESKSWRDLYEFDVPVVSAHSDIQRCFFCSRLQRWIVYSSPSLDTHQQSPASRGGPEAVWRGRQAHA